MTVVEQHPRVTQQAATPEAGGRAWREAVLWVGGGLAGGLLWGVAVRLWMRYVADQPSFSWSGTLFVLGVTSLAGLALGAVELLRRRGRGPWRLVLVVPALVVFAGQGLPFLPAAVFGGLALSGRGRWWVRGPAAALAASSLSLFLLFDEPFANSAVVTVAWYAVLCLGLAVGWVPVWRRRAPRP
ncbi:hypothetical protein [Aquipuribacter sp. SD81]|uniref:hypothetical protein n=1 Tax=Aquipuribacter sp. SD81 TaxID=3127703 RepID=UPI003015AE60